MGDNLKPVAEARSIPTDTFEGSVLAYGSLILMAVIPIYAGSFMSVAFLKSKLADKKMNDRMTSKRAAVFPIFASATLIGIYIIYKLFPKEMIDIVVRCYFGVIGICTLCHVFGHYLNNLVPVAVPKKTYIVKMYKENTDPATGFVNCTFTTHDAISTVVCALVGVWYLVTKHWIVNNIFGVSFAVSAIEMLMLDSVLTAFILLGGLFVYDIFWVFYTDVMVTVAKSFEAPIKLIFPRDLLVNGIFSNNVALLGLGDIIVPGIFIAFLLRFDKSLGRGYNLYFISSLTAYFFGLLLTVFVMHVFKHAQPALLYLVPICVLVPGIIAFFKGDLKTLFKYRDYPPENEENKES